MSGCVCKLGIALLLGAGPPIAQGGGNRLPPPPPPAVMARAAGPLGSAPDSMPGDSLAALAGVPDGDSLALPAAPAPRPVAGASAQSVRPPYVTRTTRVAIAGDGRVHAPAAIEGGYQSILPNQIDIENVIPLIGTALTFPYDINNALLEDHQTYTMERYYNTLNIKVVDCVQGCYTKLTVWLNDGFNTMKTFLLITDTTKTPTYFRNFGDEITARLRAATAALRTDAAATVERDVARRLNGEVDRCIAEGLTFKAVDRSQATEPNDLGESLGLTIHDIGFSGRCLTTPRLYLRYTISNARYKDPVTDIAWTVGWSNHKTHRVRAVRVLEDLRNPTIIPSTSRVRGTLIIDGTGTLAPGDELVVTARIDGHDLTISPVLSASRPR